MKKRFLAALIALCLLFALLPAAILPASAGDLTGSCGDNLQWVFDTQSNHLIFQGSGAMTDYSWSSLPPWASYRLSITEISIPEGVTHIGNVAFPEFNVLTSVALPQSITSIGDYGFYRNLKLQSIFIPEDVTSIGEYALFGCSELTRLRLPASLTSIGEAAFSRTIGLDGIWVAAENPQFCSDASGVLYNKDKTALLQAPGKLAGAYVIADGVTSISPFAFDDCDALTGVRVPEGVTTLERYTFRSCDALTQVHLPESLTLIGEESFRDCVALEHLTIPAKVYLVSNYVFYGCTSLADITLPDSVILLGRGAFYGCTSLQSVTLSDKLGSLIGNTFAKCTSLESIRLPSSVRSIEDTAFDGCTALTRISILNPSCAIAGSATALGAAETTTIYAADGSTAESYAEQYGYAFVSLSDCLNGQHNYQLTASTPASCTAPGSALYTCTVCLNTDTKTVPQLTHSFSDGVCTLCHNPGGSCGSDMQWAFDEAADCLYLTGSGEMQAYDFLALPWLPYRETMTTLHIEEGVTGLCSLAFCCFPALAKVTLPASLTNLPGSVFDGCSLLTSAGSIGSGCAIEFAWTDAIPANAFDFCDGLTSVTLPTTLKHIGNSAFRSCTALASVTLPSGLTDIGELAFYDCKALTGSVTIPASVTSIGKYAFGACAALNGIFVDSANQSYSSDARGVLFDREKTVLIRAPGAIAGDYAAPASVTSISDNAFNACAALTGVSFSSGVKSIGYAAFASCSALASVSLPNSVTSIAGSAFTGCSSLTGITIPSGVTSIAHYTFGNCTALARIFIPAGVTSIAQDAFTGCTSLIEIQADSANPCFYNDANGVFLNRDGTLIKAPMTLAGAYTVPDGVKEISDDAFYGCAGLTDVSFPTCLEVIGKQAFYGCSALKRVVFLGIAAVVSDNPTTLGNPESTVIYAFKDTPAQEYAQKYGYAFVCNCDIGNHSYYQVSDIVLPTCTAPRCITYTCYCGLSCKEYDMEPLGHDMVTDAVAVAPTCTQSGLTEGSHCSRCDEATTVQTELAALGHDMVTDAAAVAPTCTQSGLTEGSHCSRCDEATTVQTELAALGHSFSDGVCTVCGASAVTVADFKDVEPGRWYYDAVVFALERGLFYGTSSTTFEPNTPMNRAMLVTVLWRYEKQPKPAGAASFTDVANGKWYTDAVLWAAENQIVNGVGDGKFDPTGMVTREQMATILFRYCAKKGIATDKRIDLSSFPDASQVSGFAKVPLSWAVAEKLIGGTVQNGATYLDPKGNATRAQVATILMRFLEGIAK